jgi:hypothetical protein
MPFNKHDEVYRDLQERYRCTDCDPSGKRFCWKQIFKGWPKPCHIQLSMSILNQWATYIVDNGASKHYPPRVPEFDDWILAPLYKKNPKHVLNAGNTENGAVGIAAQQVPYFIPPSWSYAEPRKRRRESLSDSISPVKRKQQAFDSSPVSSIDNSIRVDVRLDTLQKWCEFNYKSYDWSEVFDILVKADVGLDSFTEPKTKASKILRLCSSKDPPLQPATADRLVKAHARWVRKGKPEQ